mgnify:CR=1 FL=1
MRLLSGIPGITNAKLKILPKYVENLTKEQFDSLTLESQLSIKYIKSRYTRDEITQAIDDILIKLIPGNIPWEVCGSYRRETETCKDIDVLIMADRSDIDLDDIEYIVRNGSKRVKLITYSESINIYVPIDIYFSSKESWNFSLLHLTGSKAFNIRMRKQAIRMNMKLNEYNLTKDGKEIPGLTSEKHIIKFLLGKYIHPRNR